MWRCTGKASTQNVRHFVAELRRQRLEIGISPSLLLKMLNVKIQTVTNRLNLHISRRWFQVYLFLLSMRNILSHNSHLSFTDLDNSTTLTVSHIKTPKNNDYTYQNIA